MMKFTSLCISLLILSSCGNKGTSTADNPQPLDGKYHLVSVAGETLSEKGFTFEFNADKNRVFGFTGCNGFSSSYEQEGSSISFVAPASTRKYCEGKMQTEQEILNALENISTVRREENRTVFYSETNTPLITLIKTDQSE